MKSDNIIYELKLDEILREYRESTESDLVDRKNNNWENL